MNQSFVTPDVNNYGNARFDLKINKMHTLVGRFNYNQSTQDLQGIGGFSLPSRAYRGRRTNFIAQFTETALINEKTINETRFQLIRNRFSQTSLLECVCAECARLFQRRRIASWFIVERAGSIGTAELYFVDSWKSLCESWRATQAREDRQYFAGQFWRHLYFRGRRWSRLDENDQIVLDSNGQPIIELSSLERYRRTLAFSRAGLSPAAIRLARRWSDTVFNRGRQSRSGSETN